MSNVLKGYFFAVLALLSGGGFYMVSKFVTLKFGDVTTTANMAFWGFFGAFIISTPYFLRNKTSRGKILSVTQQNLKVIISISFITSIAIFLYWYVLTLTEVGTIALLSQSNVFFSLILSLLFLGEKINKKEMILLALVVVGFLFLSTNNPELSLIAFLLILLVRFLYALQSFVVKKYGKNIDGFIFGYVRTLLIAIFLGVYAFIGGSLEYVSLPFLAITTFSILLGAILSKSFFFEAHKFLEIGRLNIFMLFQAVLTLVGSVLFFSESLGILKIVGTILIIGGLIFFTKEQLKHKKIKK